LNCIGTALYLDDLAKRLSSGLKFTANDEDQVKNIIKNLNALNNAKFDRKMEYIESDDYHDYLIGGKN
jgi:hypothetical protein